MAQVLTDAAALKAAATEKEPILVLEIDGYDRLFTAATIEKYIRIGDTGLLIGDDWKIGGRSEFENQAELMSLKQGTSNSITQQLEPDLGSVQSVASFTVRLVDKGEEITRLITPGEVFTDLMGLRARVLVGFKGTAYPDDYIELHAGNIDAINSGAGYVDIVISHPEQKKRQEIFVKLDTELGSDINDSATTIPLDAGTDMTRVLRPTAGPGGAFDSAIKYYVKIEDEVIRYTGVSGTSLTGCTRGQLGTAAAAHVTGDTVESLYELAGNAMELALKVLLSGRNGPSVEDVPVTSFLYDIPQTVNIADPRVVFFKDRDLPKETGIVPGDFMSTSGAGQADNNFSEKEIEDIVVRENGTYILMAAPETVTLELTTPAVASFRSQYDSLGHGLGLTTQEVDVARHRLIDERYLSTLEYRFYLDDTIEGRRWLAEQIYRPAACYSIPRSGKVSVGITIPPLPIDEILILDERNIIEASSIVIKRTTNKNFRNQLIYKYDLDPLDGAYKASVPKQDSSSLARIPDVGIKSLEVESEGLRSDLGAGTHINAAATRFFNRYRYAAEHIDGLKLLYGVGFKVEVGDIVLLDPTNLHMSDTEQGNRRKNPRFFEIRNKTQPLAPGPVSVDLIDTNFSTQNRYGLRSPSSLVKETISARSLHIKPSFSRKYGENEWRKWAHLAGREIMLTIHSPDSNWTNQCNAILESASGNVLTFDRDLAYTPAEDDIVQLSTYNLQSEIGKTLYAHMRDSAFDDGKPQYRMV